jgi:hypothetical protein
MTSDDRDISAGGLRPTGSYQHLPIYYVNRAFGLRRPSYLITFIGW